MLSEIYFYQALVIPENIEQQDELQDILLELESNDMHLEITIRKDPLFNRSYLCKCSGKLHLEIILSRAEEMGVRSIILFCFPDYKVTKVEGVKDIANLERKHIKCVEEEYLVGDLIYPLRLMHKIKSNQLFTQYIQDENMIINNNNVLNNITIPSWFFLNNFHKLIESMHGEVDFIIKESIKERIDYDIVNIMCNDQPLHFNLILKRNEEDVLKLILEGLAKGIKRGQVLINLQAKIGDRTVRSYKIKPYRKDVTSKCYGGDKTRKQKLLSKQKAGKKNRQQETVIKFERNLFVKRGKKS